MFYDLYDCYDNGNIEYIPFKKIKCPDFLIKSGHFLNNIFNFIIFN